MSRRESELKQGSRTWWVALVYAVAVLNLLGVLLGLFGRFDAAAIAVFLAGAVLAIVGLRLQRTNPVVGSWMIVGACIPPMIPFWIVVPALISLVTLASGLVTRELELTPSRT